VVIHSKTKSTEKEMMLIMSTLYFLLISNSFHQYQDLHSITKNAFCYWRCIPSKKTLYCYNYSKDLERSTAAATIPENAKGSCYHWEMGTKIPCKEGGWTKIQSCKYHQKVSHDDSNTINKITIFLFFFFFWIWGFHRYMNTDDTLMGYRNM
jgi:hypothetical protein